MTWLKLDDNFFGDPKVVAAGRDARDLFLAGLTYCSRHLTDGRIPAGALARIAADAEVSAAAQLAERLVEVGLWAHADDDYVVPKYLKYNPSAQQIATERDAARRRKGGSPGFRPNSGRSIEKGAENGLARIPGSPSRIEREPVPSRIDVRPEEAPEESEPLARTHEGIDEKFAAAMEDEFWEVLGSREAVRTHISAALGHKARLNYTDQRAYVRNWLLGDVDRAQTRRKALGPPAPPGRNGISQQDREELRTASVVV